MYSNGTKVLVNNRRGDLRDHRAVKLLLSFDHDLVSNLAAVDLNISREIKRHADALAFDRGNPHNPDGVLWISDHNFFALSSGNDKHPWLHFFAGFVAERSG